MINQFSENDKDRKVEEFNCETQPPREVKCKAERIRNRKG